MLARDEADEQVCGNEVCGCTLPDDGTGEFCSDYCSGEGTGRGEGICQCGHVGCA